MAKTCGGSKRVPDTLVRAGQLRETTPTEKQDCLGFGIGLTTPPQIRNTVTKSKEAKTGPIYQG